MSKLDLNNKIAVVTGASDGIGKQIAITLAQEGALVYALARSADKLQALSEQVSGRIIGVPVDLCDAEASEKAFAEINAKAATIDVLVNNVGGGTFKPLHKQTRAEVLFAVDLPYRAAMQACHAFVPRMREQRSGYIVNLTSPAGFVPFPYMAPYVASRHAMAGLSESLYEELKPLGINSLLFCPAEVNTGYFERKDASVDWYPKASGIFPVLEPEQVATQILRSMQKRERRKIYPLSLSLFVRAYMLMPRTSVLLLRLVGLWRPRAKVES